MGTAAVPPPPRRLFTLEDVRVGLADMSRANLYRLVRKGDLKTVSIGRRKYVTAAELDRYVASLEESAALVPTEVEPPPLQAAKGKRRVKTAIERKTHADG
jgi:Helix-turn-helix domain